MSDYSTFPYIYAVAAKIHGYPPEASRDVYECRRGYADYIPAKHPTPGFEIDKIFDWTSKAMSLFNTEDYEPKDESIFYRLSIYVSLFNDVVGLDRDVIVKKEMPIFKEHISKGTFYNEEGKPDIYLLNNLIRMYRKEPLVY